MSSLLAYQYSALRYFTMLSIVVLLILSVYYLNATLEALKMLIEHIDNADKTLERNMKRNATIGRLMIAPLHRSAHEYYQQTGKLARRGCDHNQLTLFVPPEPKLIMNIISYSALIVFCFSGLVATLRQHALCVLVFGLSLDVIYCSSFLYSSRLNPSICAFIVFVSVLSLIHARQVWRHQHHQQYSTKAMPHPAAALGPTESQCELVRNTSTSIIVVPSLESTTKATIDLV